MKHELSGSLTVIATICAAVLLSNCGGDDSTTATVAVPYTNGTTGTSNSVAYWNKIATETINIPPAATGTAEEQRPILQVDLATVHVAIYDAVNAITGTYTLFGPPPATQGAGASQEAATAAAAVGVLKGLFPNRSTQYQTAYDTFIGALPTGDGKTRGIALGTEVATGILALRANDGRSTVVSYTPGTTAGKFRGVNPVGIFNRYVKPFTLTSASQFRVAPPPALDSAAYAADFNEVLALGGATSTVRTAAQLESARFHTEAPPAFLTRNYRAFAMDSRTVADNARESALVYVAMADATIACFESKYFYDFWRPMSAIPLADTDGNGATAMDAAWVPVVPTPNHPEYPSAHMCVNSAAMAALKAYFGTPRIAFSFGSTVTGTVRQYASPDELLDEIVLARITGGMHFRSANVQGGVLGTNVGNWVAEHYFKPL